MKNLKIILATSIVLIATFLAPSIHAENLSQNLTHAMESIVSKDYEIVTTYYKDLDQDGVKDQFDHCPNSFYGTEVDQLGCELDSDSDGVVDRFDKCTSTPYGAVVNTFGCQNDEDGDGVYDSQDSCPGTPKGARVDFRGCAIVEVDIDQDQIDDSVDECTDTPFRTKVNGLGCAPVERILTNIVFDSYAHDVREDQASILRQDAAHLSDLNDNEVILITGHTDYQGMEPINLRLSWRRANSAKQFLIKELGHSEDRVYIMGKGEMEPIADNETEDGRQKNRRIELKVITDEALPIDAQLNIPEEMLKR
ncbi:MAG: OmpA-OmpF porin, OOP family [Thiomicrorhabdus sp.]|nr:MAG: OmpA-OmpF porin, OOP family [Thiomicrorhabdus sp.]